MSNEFRKGQWSGGLPETVSGSGSTMKNTLGVREFLPNVIKEYKIKSVFDAPCGDRNWIKTLDFEGLDCTYSGADIVSEIVADINLPFVRVFDIRIDTPPVVDLWFCRDCLFHLSESDIKIALCNMITNSEIQYLLVTSHTMDAQQDKLNRDIFTGDFRVLILEEHNYFGLQAPIAIFEDPSDSYISKVMMLFDLRQTRQ